MHIALFSCLSNSISYDVIDTADTTHLIFYQIFKQISKSLNTYKSADIEKLTIKLGKAVFRFPG